MGNALVLALGDRAQGVYIAFPGRLRARFRGCIQILVQTCIEKAFENLDEQTCAVFCVNFPCMEATLSETSHFLFLLFATALVSKRTGMRFSKCAAGCVAIMKARIVL